MFPFQYIEINEKYSLLNRYDCVPIKMLLGILAKGWLVFAKPVLLNVKH